MGNEDSLLNVLPEVALEQHQVANVPTIRGFTSDEWARVVLGEMLACLLVWLHVSNVISVVLGEMLACLLV